MNIMSSKPKTFGCKEDWIIIIIILVLIIGAIAPAFLSSPTCSRSKALRICCTSNLKQIGLSLKQYSMDYADFFPPENNAAGLEKLRSLDYLTDYGVYLCPQTRKSRGTSGPITDKICDYIYLGGSKEGENPDIPLAFDKPGNHTNYINVLFLDGHVKGYNVAGLKNCESIIIFLNSEHKYSPKLFKNLSDKAKKVDSTLSP